MSSSILHDMRAQPLPDWSEDTTRVPYWVYQDDTVRRAEQQKVFAGPTWNYLCLEAEIPAQGDFRTTFVGSMPVIVVARLRRRDLRVREPLRASRRADRAGRRRQRARLHLRLSRLELRPRRQPQGAWPSRTASKARAAWPRSFCRSDHGPRKLRIATLSGLVFGSLVRRRAADRGLSRRGDRQPHQAGAAQAGQGDRPLHARCCRTTGSSTSRTSRTPTTRACCTCSSRRSASTGCRRAAA